jgi:hypothetical protein
MKWIWVCILVFFWCMGIAVYRTESAPSKMRREVLSSENPNILPNSPLIVNATLPIELADIEIKAETQTGILRDEEKTPSLEKLDSQELPTEKKLADKETPEDAMGFVHSHLASLNPTEPALLDMIRHIRQNFITSKDIARNARTFIPELNERLFNAENTADKEHTIPQSTGSLTSATHRLRKRDFSPSDTSLPYAKLINRNPPITVNTQHTPGKQLMARSMQMNTAMMNGRMGR